MAVLSAPHAYRRFAEWIRQMLNAEFLNLINAPGSANLYWALSELLIDIRTALQHENILPLQIFPFLKDAEANRSKCAMRASCAYRWMKDSNLRRVKKTR